MTDTMQNQYLILLVNILVADIIQGSSYTFSFHWIRLAAIISPSHPCTAQGWLLNTGDLTSALFVLFIAVHTFYRTVCNRRMNDRVFYLLIGITWIFGVVISCLGPAIHGQKYYVRAGVVCWVSNTFQTERLTLHYLWIFTVQAGSILLYLAVYIHIRLTVKDTKSLGSLRPSKAHKNIDRAARIMGLYPAVYLMVSLPISTGRMWSMAHGGANLPTPFLLAAATIYGSTGFANTLLYTLTRRQLVSKGATISESRSAPPSRPGFSRGQSYRSMREQASTKTEDSGKEDQTLVSVNFAVITNV